MHSLFTIYESFGRFSRNYRDIRLRLGNFNIVPFKKKIESIQQKFGTKYSRMNQEEYLWKIALRKIEGIWSAYRTNHLSRIIFDVTATMNCSFTAQNLPLSDCSFWGLIRLLKCERRVLYKRRTTSRRLLLI